MSFRFNFEVNGDCESNEIAEEHVKESPTFEDDVNNSNEIQENAKLYKLADLKVEWEKSGDVLYSIETVDIKEGITMFFVQPHTDNQPESKEATELSSKLEMVPTDSDLIPGIYEGGLKVWECSIDLVNFLLSEKFEKKKIETVSILELGCGIGLPGICAANLGAETVCFQDFNDFVITNATAPSLLLNEKRKQENLADEVIADLNVNDLLFMEKTDFNDKKFTFVSGDWTSVGEVLDKKFEFILSAETIYCVDYYERLHTMLHQSLSTKGSILIAAKSFYFGVGGGVHLWEEFVKSKGIFCTEIVETFDASLPRQIVKMTFKS